jgi:hypothetical protein
MKPGRDLRPVPKGASMELVKKTGDVSIYKKRSGRYAVQNAKGGYVSGEDKVKILKEEGLLKVTEPKAKPAEDENQSEG